MLRSVALAALALVLASSVPIASALDDQGACCFCSTGGAMAQSPGFINGTAVPALFCATVRRGEAEELANRCQQLTGGLLQCLVSKDGTNSSCRVQLADELGVLCPTSAAPAAGGASLLSLAVALGALGALLQRRSQKRRALD